MLYTQRRRKADRLYTERRRKADRLYKPAKLSVTRQLYTERRKADRMGPAVPDTFIEVDSTLHQVPNLSGGNH